MSEAIAFTNLRFYHTNSLSSFLNGQHKWGHLLSISSYLINCPESASHRRLYLTLHVNNKQRRTLTKRSCLCLVFGRLSWILTACLRQQWQGDRRWDTWCWTVFKTFIVHTSLLQWERLQTWLEVTYRQFFMQRTAIRFVSCVDDGEYCCQVLEEQLTKENWF